MTSDEHPRENEPSSDIEQGPSNKAAATQQSTAQPSPQPAAQQSARAEIVLRKHHICPYLGLRDDRTVVAMLPTPAHACYARKKRYTPSIEHQMVRCLSSNYPGCSIYPDSSTSPKAGGNNPFTLQDEFGGRGGYWRWLQWLGMALLALLVVGGTAYAFTSGLVSIPTNLVSSVSSLLAPITSAPTAEVIATEANASGDSGNPAPPANAVTDDTPPPATEVLAVVAEETATPTATTLPVETFTPVPAVAQVVATPEAGAETVTIAPSRADVGWWASAQTQPGLLGDSFLYAGVYDQQAYMSMVRFDLQRIPRGARIQSGMIRLTGLRDNLLDRTTNSSWGIQILSEGAVPEIAGTTFFSLYEAPVSFQILPNVQTADVGPTVVNEWMLDSTTRGWLYQQLLDGATSVLIRIIPLENSGNALFAWDSGHGPESGGASPQLILSLADVPPTPPPTATRPQVVATLTPTPENVMTVVALTPAATPAEQVPPTNTPVPPEVVTPTPVAMDLSAVQTAAVAEGRPPVLLHTPTPANAATATTNAIYATAVALTTGTFTPVPTDFVTPVLYLPSPPPENVATAAARSEAATAQARLGTPTPTRQSNAVDAIYEFATPTPATEETAIARIVEQNRVAVTTGTPTPTPWNLVIITRVPEPTPTPIPLFIPTSQMVATATATPTRVLTMAELERFRGQILFLSNRDGTENVWVFDPAQGIVTGMLTERRIYTEARERFLPFSPDGRERVFVERDGDTSTQIKIENFEYQVFEQLTHLQGLSYDPTWSPRGDLIAFTSNASGGDEIYTISPDGGDPTRLTFNSWEWDKHPTWSPDGRQIAFFSNRESGRRQIWIMDVDGNNQYNASNSIYEDWDPIWVR